MQTQRLKCSCGKRIRVVEGFDAWTYVMCHFDGDLSYGPEIEKCPRCGGRLPLTLLLGGIEDDDRDIPLAVPA